MEPADTTRVTLLVRLRDRADKLSWQEFNDRYGELLYRYARGRGASHQDAEDVVQDVIMYLFKAMEGFEYDARKGRFRSYLRAAVVNALARRHKKKAKQEAVLDPQDFDFMGAQEEASMDARWHREWQLHRLRWAMKAIAGTLDQVTIQAFEMHVLNDVSVEETATRLDLSKASVYQAKSRILKKLKEQLAEADPDGDV